MKYKQLRMKLPSLIVCILPEGATDLYTVGRLSEISSLFVTYFDHLERQTVSVGNCLQAGNLFKLILQASAIAWYVFAASGSVMLSRLISLRLVSLLNASSLANAHTQRTNTLQTFVSSERLVR